MPDSAIRSALDEAVKAVLERMFFIAAGDPLSPGAAAEPSVQVRLTFEGEPSGSLHLRVALPAARSISADFLGIERAEVSEQQIGEVVCELANMICGSLLSRTDSSATFRLGAPAIVPDVLLFDDPSNSTVCSLDTGSGALTAILTTESPACSAAEKSAY
jgi:hypothetical protein